MNNTALAPRQTFDLSPQTFEQALTFSKYLADSDMVPKDFRGKPGNCLVAMQWGMEVGLKPLQALQNIAVINGRPALWGDAVIALVRGSPVCESINETDDGHTATCRVKRKGEPEQVRTFSMDDAQAAGLLGKQGPWTQYAKRMRQMRARAFALRDVFPDVLRGMAVVEELQDLEVSRQQGNSPTTVHMGQAEEVRQPWADEAWQATAPKLVKGILDGKTIEAALQWANAKATVTPAQEQALREAVAQAQQAAQQQAASEPPSGIDPLQLEQAMTAQTNIDALYDMAIHIDNVADEAARARLGQVLEAKARELES